MSDKPEGREKSKFADIPEFDESMRKLANVSKESVKKREEEEAIRNRAKRKNSAKP